uniref:Uncharacterized protein n=1 Tax=Acrobeloides nanus TaxID=290746 RepID=A0A914DAH9_9BILA
MKDGEPIEQDEISEQDYDSRSQRELKRNYPTENDQDYEFLLKSVKPLTDYLLFKRHNQLSKTPTYHQNESIPGWTRIPGLWFDILLFMPRNDVEKCQYINRFLCGLVEAHNHLLPLRKFESLTIGCLFGSVRSSPYKVFITPADLSSEHFPHFVQLFGEKDVKKINEKKRKELKFLRYSIIETVKTMDFCKEIVETMKRLVEISGEKLKAIHAYTTTSDYSSRWAEVLDKYLLAHEIIIKVKEDEASMNFILSLLTSLPKYFIPLTTEEINISFSVDHSTNKPKINLQNLLKFLLSDQVGIYRYNIKVGATPDNACENFSNSIVEAYVNNNPLNLPSSLRFDCDFPREFFYKKCKKLQEDGILVCVQFTRTKKEYATNGESIIKHEYITVFRMKRADNRNVKIEFYRCNDFNWMNVAFNKYY